MPIYEYRCAGCQRRVSLFFRSISAAQSGAAEARCPHCGGANLSRLVSRVSFIGAGRLGDKELPQGALDSDMPEEDYGGVDGPDGGMPGLEDLMAGVDDEDPRSVARWARQMQSQIGEDLGPDFNTALTRIEAGEDPDRVLDDVDPSLGMGAGEADEDLA